MNTITIPANIDDAAQFKGETVRALLTDGTELTGQLISINSKGWNFNIEGTVVSRGIAKVAAVTVTVNNIDDLTDTNEIDTDTDECPRGCDNDGDCEDEFHDGGTTELDALVAELDGATTAELADVFGIAAKELRVTLRALGMGVGKGHRYHLNAEQIAVVKVALNA